MSDLDENIDQESIQAADRLMAVAEPVTITQDSTLQNDQPITPENSSIRRKGKRLFTQKKFVLGLVFLAMVVIGLTATLVVNKRHQSNIQTESLSKKMGAQVLVADGNVFASHDNQYWKEIKADEQITEGTYIKTAENGRAVINLDDGSAVRIGSSSIIKAQNLDPNNIAFSNEKGVVYSRVVPSERVFSVTTGQDHYQAMGTAYLTINTDSTRGVEVFHSKVKLQNTDVLVPEGKYYYSKASSPDLQNKLGDVSVEKMKQDSFLAWNYELDKKEAEFKNKLGYLSNLEQGSSPAPTAPSQPPQVANISLSASKTANGVKLSWQISGLSAPYGFKVLKGTAPNPTYGNSSYKYLSSADTRSYVWEIADGGSYNFRVCVYNGEGCAYYSNNVLVTAPLATVKEPKAEDSVSPSGTTTLTATGGNNFSWSLNGSAPKGYKLVWSTAPNPVYPGSDYQYYSSQDTKNGTITPKASGAYFVRVCIYTGGGCIGYSNQLSITVN